MDMPAFPHPKRSGVETHSFLEKIRRGQLVGRDQEVAESLVWLNRARSNEGSVLLISGEPGIGKTRLSQELIHRAQALGFRIFFGACYAEGGPAYGPIVQMVRAALRNYASSPAVLPDFPFHLMTSDAILGEPYRGTFSPARDHQQIIESVGAWFEKVCEASPVFIVLEDVHWAGTTVLELLRRLARMARYLPLVIALTYRPGELDSPRLLDEIITDLNRERLAVQIQLNRLDPVETEAMLAAMRIENIQAAFIDNLYRQTEGNPFFIEEVCKALVEEGYLKNRAGRWYLTESAVIRIPNSVRSAIQTRVGLLAQKTQDVLRLAAIQGHTFDFEVLKRSCTEEEEKVIQAVEDAVRASLIEEIESSPGEAVRFRFAHVLIPVTLRESIIRLRRLHLHRQVAQAIETLYPDEHALLAYHFTEAADEPSVRKYAVRAGDSLQRMAPAEAARFYRTALLYMPEKDKSTRADLLAKFGYCLWITADTKAALQVFTDAYDVYHALGDLTQSGEMQRMIGRIHWEDADREKALAHYRLAAAIHAQRPGTIEQARAISSMSQMHMLADEADQAIALGRQALELAEKLGAEDVRVHALNNIGTSLVMNGDVAAGFASIQESLDRSLAAGLPFDALRAYFNMTGVLHRKCRYEEEIAIIEKMRELAVKVYARNYIYLAFQRLCWVNWLIGNWQLALQYREQVGVSNSPLYTAWTQRMFAEIHIDLGQYDLARQLLEESKDHAFKANEIQTTLPHLHQLARVYHASGSRAAEEGIIYQIIDFILKKQIYSEEVVTSIVYCVYWLAGQQSLGMLEKARVCHGFLERLKRAGGSIEVEAAFAESSGYLSLADEKLAEAAAHFDNAAALWQRIKRRYHQAHVLTMLGKAQIAQGEVASARAALDQAAALYQGLADQIDGALKKSLFDAHPAAEVRQLRRSLGAGEQVGLSPRERQVALLVRQGRTNREIAGELFISERTVEKHVENILNRLGFHSRAQIAGWVADQGRDFSNEIPFK